MGIDSFLLDLFSPDASGPATFAQRFSPFAGASADVPSQADVARPSLEKILQGIVPPMPSPQQYLRQLGPSPSMAPPDGGMSEELSARAAMPPAGGDVPLPQARPNIESILAGGGGGPAPAAAPAAPVAPAGAPAAPSDVFSRLAGMLGGNNVQGSAPVTPAQKVSLLGRLAGLDPRADNQFRSALAGGFAGGNPAFKGGAFMKGAAGALGGGLKSEKDQSAADKAASDAAAKQSNYDRSQTDKEKTSAALRSLYERRAAVTGTGRAAWNKPAAERWKDAQKLLIDKQKQVYGTINPLAPKADRDAQKAAADKELADFKNQTYQQYGFSPDGTDQAPMARPGGEVPSTSKTVGDKEATDAGLYPKGTYDDPAKPQSKEEFDALPPGAIFVNPADGRIMSKRG